MTEKEMREKLVETALLYEDSRAADGKCPQWVVNAYNDIVLMYAGIDGSLPRKSKMSRSYPWCAAFASVCQFISGFAEKGIYEMSCGNLIKIAKKRFMWEESDAFKPTPGDLILYDWNDKKDQSADNSGDPDHVGIVVEVNGTVMTVMEGNNNHMVKRREVSINGRYIRGFIHFKFDEENIAEPETVTEVRLLPLKKGDRGQQVKTMQMLINGRCNTMISADGVFGSATQYAVKVAQSFFNLANTGECDIVLWSHLING